MSHHGTLVVLPVDCPLAKKRRYFLVRFAYPDGRPLSHGGTWTGVVVTDTDPLNALIQARHSNRDLPTFREMVVLDVCYVTNPLYDES